MKKAIILPLFLLFTLIAYAQNGKAPYFIENEKYVVFQADTFPVENIAPATLELIRSKIDRKADEKNNEGVELFEAKDYDGALTAFEEALQVRPNFEKALLNKAATHIAQQKTSEAISSYEKVAEANSNNFDAHFYLGVLKFEAKDYQGSITSLDKALEIKTDNAQAFNYRGSAKKQSGDNVGAEQDFAKAVELESSFGEALSNLADIQLANQEFQKATDNYDEAISAGVTSASILNNKGKALFELSKFDEAIQSFDKSISSDGNFWMAIHNKATTLCKLEKYSEALPLFDKVISQKSDYAIAYLNRGIAKEMLKDQDGACADWNKAKELGNNEASIYASESCN